MKLLFDQNLSARPIEMLIDSYPDSDHVRLLGMSTDDDKAIWRYARRHNFIIVSKDLYFSVSEGTGSGPLVECGC